MTPETVQPTTDTYRDEIGADGCGCPITVELTTANGSEVDGTQRTEHRANCWEIKTEGPPTGYAVTTAELRRLADVLDTLPPGDKPLYTHVSLLPGEATVEVVEAIAVAVTGKPGKSEHRDDKWLYLANSSDFGKHFSVGIQATVPGPPDPKDAELERLRAELAALKPAADPDHGRTTAVAEAKPDTLMVPHGDPHRTAAPPELKPWESSAPLADRIAESMEPIPSPAAVSARSFQDAPIRSDETIGRPEDIGRVRLADEPEGGPIVRYFSFGHGQTDPTTSENLLNKYVTVIAPTAEGCREAMLASRFGREWAFEYIPGRPQADEWIPQWTEHERIVVDPSGGE